ncbi:hypothetical protein FO519_000119 [Halicephalobus sp. NKZ332]|nr:hypothetical protein FO519_000119 [Halicephalobus sp. NKZ332]
MSSLTVLCPNARRCKVPITPGKLLREVLETACLMQGYDTDHYELQFHGKHVDESLTFRLSGLPNNACLDMVLSTRKTGAMEVEIALDVQGVRKTKAFPATTTLSELLAGFSKEFQMDLSNPGEGKYASVTYLSKQWKGDAVLSSSTLKSMGIYSGGAVLRFSTCELSEEEKKAIDNLVAAVEERRKQLTQVYEQKKIENQQRIDMEARYQKELEEQQRIEEEKQRIQEEERRIQEKQRETEKNQRALNAQRMETDASVEGQNSRDQGSSEIERLEATLRILNSSLQSGRSDSLVDHLLSERGTLRTDVEMEDLTVAANTPYNPPVDFSNFKFPDKKIEVSYAVEEEKIQEEIDVSPPESRQAVIFDRILSEEKRKEMEETDEAVYETTAQDIKILQRNLKDQASGQRAFVPKRFVDAKNRERKLNAYQNTVIRFILSENRTIQAVFYSKESTNSIFDFVESMLVSNSIKYDLVFFLKEKLTRDKFKNLIDSGLAPKSNLILRFGETISKEKFGTIFKEGFLKEVTLDEADILSKEWLSVNSGFVPYNPMVHPESQGSQFKRNAEAAGNDNEGPPPQRRNVEGLPKWFKK